MRFRQAFLRAFLLVSSFVPLAVSAAYTSTTAPDAIGRQVLAKPLLHINAGSLDPSTFGLSIHANLPQIIEQNFAALDSIGSARLIDNLSDRELTDLHYYYGNAVRDSGRSGNLLPLLAYRLDATRLGRLSAHFGYAATHAAVAIYAPSKLNAFMLAASMYPESDLPPSGAQGAPTMAGIGAYMNYTPYEIYLDFRTAPVGALGVTGALYETSMVLGTAIGVSYGAGYTAGTAAAALIQNYSPSLWNTIGGTVAGMVTQVQNAATLAQQGQYMQAAGALFGLDSATTYQESTFGGDYECAAPWADVSSGGGGGGRSPHYPIDEE